MSDDVKVGDVVSYGITRNGKERVVRLEVTYIDWLCKEYPISYSEEESCVHCGCCIKQHNRATTLAKWRRRVREAGKKRRPPK